MTRGFFFFSQRYAGRVVSFELAPRRGMSCPPTSFKDECRYGRSSCNKQPLLMAAFRGSQGQSML